MTRMVLLRHDEPGGGFHYDWMLERPRQTGDEPITSVDGNSRTLLTLRVHQRVDLVGGRGDRPGSDAPVGAGVGEDVRARRSITAELLADHRAAYLDYEGNIGGGRGRVTRVASGRVRRLTQRDGTIEVDCEWDANGDGAPVSRVLVRYTVEAKRPGGDSNARPAA